MNITIFCITQDLTQTVNFPNEFPYCDVNSSLVSDFCFASNAGVFLLWLSFIWEMLVLFQFVYLSVSSKT